MVEMKEVVSSNLDALGYDEVTGELHVRFKGNQATYVYPVGRQIYDELMAAPSVGSHFIKHVKNVVDKRLVRKVEDQPACCPHCGQFNCKVTDGSCNRDE